MRGATGCRIVNGKYPDVSSDTSLHILAAS